MLPTDMFQRRPHMLLKDSEKKGLLKCGAICRSIMLVARQARPSQPQPRKVYRLMAAKG